MSGEQRGLIADPVRADSVTDEGRSLIPEGQQSQLEKQIGGDGIYLEELKSELEARGLPLPRMTGIRHWFAGMAGLSLAALAIVVTQHLHFEVLWRPRSRGSKK